MANIIRAWLGFCGMKWLGVLLLPSDESPWKVTLQNFVKFSWQFTCTHLQEVARIFKEGGGVILCQTEGTPQIVMLTFTLCFN